MGWSIPCRTRLGSFPWLTMSKPTGVSRGLGRHVWAAQPDSLYAAALALFISEICYTFTMAFVKLSILAFYWRSFSVHFWIKWSTVLLGSSVLMWAVAVVCLAFLTNPSRIYSPPPQKAVVTNGPNCKALCYISSMSSFTIDLAKTWPTRSIGCRRRVRVQSRRRKVLLWKRYTNHCDGVCYWCLSTTIENAYFLILPQVLLKNKL